MSTIDPTDMFLGLDSDQFDAQMASAVLAFTTSQQVKDRAEELAEKVNFGSISSEEHAEYLRYIDLAEVLAIMKSRARRFLETQQA